MINIIRCNVIPVVSDIYDIHSVFVSFMHGQTSIQHACRIVNAEMMLSFVIDIRNTVCYNMDNELRVFTAWERQSGDPFGIRRFFCNSSAEI